MKQLVAIILLVVFGLDGAFAKRLITIAGDEWCPINCSQHSSEQGFLIEVAALALSFSGYQVRYIEVPWNRAVKLAREGEIDAIVGAFKGDAPDFLFPNEIILSISPSSLFTRSDSSWQFENLKSLDSKTLAVVTGYDYGEAMNHYIASRKQMNDESLISLFGNNVITRNIDLLRNHRVDVIVASNIIFWHHTNKFGDASNFREVAQIQPEEPVSIAFSPITKDGLLLVNDFDNGIRHLKLEQQITDIANKYGIKLLGENTLSRKQFMDID